MNRVLGGILISAVMVVPALAALKTSDKAPEFSTKASLAGKEFNFSLKDALKKGPVVVYFYPSAFTGGCNIEAHNFAENKEKFDAGGPSNIRRSRGSNQPLNPVSARPEYCPGQNAGGSRGYGGNGQAYGLTKTAIRAGMKDTRGVEI